MAMTESSYNWSPSPHTADLAIAISATDHAGLFRAALAGLIGSLEVSEEPPLPEEITEYTLHQESGAIESNLVDFLNECIYLMEVEDLVPCDLRSVHYSGATLEAVLLCRPVGKPDLEAIGHIKAATYSDLEVKKSGERYEAVIVFDT